MLKGDPEEKGVIVEGAKQKLHEFTESVKTALPGNHD
jgi:pyruvate dehydrogenase (quinone)